MAGDSVLRDVFYVRCGEDAVVYFVLVPVSFPDGAFFGFEMGEGSMGAIAVSIAIAKRK